MAKATRTTSGRSSAKPSPKNRAQAPVKGKVTAAAKATKRVRSAKSAKSVKSVKSVKSGKAAKKIAVKKVAAKKPPVKSTKSVKAAKVPAKAAKKVPVKAPAKGGAKAVKAPVKGAAKPIRTAVKPGKGTAKAPGKAAAGTAAKAAKGKVVKGPPALVPKPAPSRPVLSEVVTRKHRSPAVAASTMERLKVQLIEERGQHVRQMEGLQAEADALANEREPGDTQFDEESGEGDTLSVERERDLALSASARQTVEDIAKALARMDDGTYGYCEVCGDRIPVPRLEAIPWADQCVKCKSRGERRR
jgi:RNA polymerase-binding protein DksA